MTSQAQLEHYGKIKQQAGAVLQLPWHYVGGECLQPNGAIRANALPQDATIFTIEARGGAVNYEINGVTASATSPGYVADGQSRVVGPLDNLFALWLYGGDASTYAHLQYWRES